MLQAAFVLEDGHSNILLMGVLCLKFEVFSSLIFNILNGEMEGIVGQASNWVNLRPSVVAKVYSRISGPQTFSDFFYIMKVCEETVLCN